MTNFVMMEKFNEILKKQRLKKDLLIKDVASAINVDAALVSKYEKGERIPAERSLPVLAEILGIPAQKLFSIWLADKVFDQLNKYPEAKDVLSRVEELMQDYKKQAKQPLPVNIKKELKELDVLKTAIRKFHPLNNVQLQKIKEYFNINYTFESNRIEGNTLSLQETALVVNDGITISGKSMKEHLEVINHAEALGYIQDVAQSKVDISERLIREIHYLVLKTIDKDSAGKYRQTDVRITGSEHKPVGHFEVPTEMQKLMKYYSEQQKNLHPVILAADIHWMLAGIHPFIDGNGRTSRLMMNLILLKNGYHIANLKGDLKSRLSYYKSLEKAQVHQDSNEFRMLVIGNLKDALQEYLSLVDGSSKRRN